MPTGHQGALFDTNFAWKDPEFILRENMSRHEALRRQRLEHMIHGRGLLGTIRILQDVGNTSTHDFTQRNTEAGNRDTACINTAKPDVGADGTRNKR